MVRVYDHRVQLQIGSIPAVNPVSQWIRKYRLTLLFALTALVAITITTTLVVNRIASEIAESSVIGSVEEKAVRDAEHLVSGHHSDDDGAMLTMQDLASPEGLETFLMSEESLNIVKFNLFELDRIAVWSTDPATIGKINHSTSLWPQAVNGVVGSKFERDKTLVILSGESRTADIVETYLPLRDTTSGEIIGVVEVYSDVGNQFALGVAATKRTILRTTVATMGGLFLVLLGFIVAADLTIYRSNRREKSLAKEAQQALGGKIQEQVSANERLEAEIAKRQRIEEDQRRLAEEKQIVADIGQIITSTLNIEEVYEKFAQEMKKLVDFELASINLIDQEAGTRTLKYHYGPAREDQPVGSVQPLQDTPSQTVLDTGQTLRREDAADDVRYPSDLKHAKNGMHAAITVPLISKGRIIGTIVLRSKQVGAFGPREQAILEGLANQIAPAVENAQLYEQTKHIQEEVHRLSQAVAYMNDGLLMVNLDGRIFFANPAAERMYGFEPGEMRGVEIWSLRSDANAITGRQIYEEVKAGGWTGELIATRKNGDEFPIRLSSVPVVDEEGQLVCTMGINTDITERKLAEQKLAQQAQELSRSNQELEQFAHIASHDLQEPLRMVSSYTQLLERRYKDKLDADANEFIGYAVDGARRMQTQINDLLAYSRVTTGGNRFEPTDCSGIFEQAVSNLAAAIEESGAVVTRDPLPTLMADASQLVSLFQNLIGNGIKYHGEQLPRIHVSAVECGEEWLFSLSDNGIGIEAEYAVVSRNP